MEKTPNPAQILMDARSVAFDRNGTASVRTDADDVGVVRLGIGANAGSANEIPMSDTVAESFAKHLDGLVRNGEPFALMATHQGLEERGRASLLTGSMTEDGGVALGVRTYGLAGPDEPVSENTIMHKMRPLDAAKLRDAVSDIVGGARKSIVDTIEATEAGARAGQPIEPTSDENGDLKVDLHVPAIESALASAPIFKKCVDVRAERVTEAGVLDTVLKDGSHETSNDREVGNWDVTNPDGETYSMTDEQFRRRYEPLPGSPGTFRSIGHVKAIENPFTGDAVSIDAPWGSRQRADADCLVLTGCDAEGNVTDPTDVYLCDREAFDDTYMNANELAALDGVNDAIAHGTAPESLRAFCDDDYRAGLARLTEMDAKTLSDASPKGPKAAANRALDETAKSAAEKALDEVLEAWSKMSAQTAEPESTGSDDPQAEIGHW